MLLYVVANVIFGLYWNIEYKILFFF